MEEQAEQVIITNLGRPRKLPESGYRKATYRFEDSIEMTSTVFGFSLLRWLRAFHSCQSIRLIILGTRNSSWPALLYDDDVFSMLSEDELESLEEMEASDAFQQKDLSWINDLLSKHFSCVVQCRIIPFGLSRGEQSAILEILARETPEGADLYFDITHGFRHLPLLGLLSAFHLRRVRKADVKGIYYAAFEAMAKDNVAPVVTLDFATDMMDWIEGMAIVDKTGNLAAIASLPGLDVNISRYIEDTAFFENTLSLERGRSAADRVSGLIKTGDLPFPANLYQEKMLSLLSWTGGASFADRQLSLARRALDCGDYLRCSILLIESVITASIPPDEDPRRYQNREAAKNRINRSEDYTLLNSLRNQLVHPGTRVVSPRVKELLGDKLKMSIELKRIMTRIENNIITRAKNSSPSRRTYSSKN